MRRTLPRRYRIYIHVSPHLLMLLINLFVRNTLKYKKADIIVGTEVRKSAGFVLLIISYSSQR